MRRPIKQETVTITLRNRLLSGYYPLGGRLPDERALALELGVSRKTLRIALEKLESEGLLDRSPRLGTYVHPGHESQVEYCYYILPCHDILRCENYPSIIGHTRLISSCCLACERRHAQCIMMPMSNDNNPEHLLEERLCNLPMGSRLIITGAGWYQSLMPLFLSRHYRLAMYHTIPECFTDSMDNALFIGFDGCSFVRKGLEFLNGLGCLRPLLVVDSQHVYEEEADYPSVHVSNGDSEGLRMIHDAFMAHGCDSLFCEACPAVTSCGCIHDALKLPYDVQILMNDNLMDYSCVMLPPHLIGFDIMDMARRGIDFLYSDRPGGCEMCDQIILKPNHWRHGYEH